MVSELIAGAAQNGVFYVVLIMLIAAWIRCVLWIVGLVEVWIVISGILYYAIVMLRNWFNKRDTLNIIDAVNEKGEENKTL